MLQLLKLLFSRIYHALNSISGKNDRNPYIAMASIGFLVAFNGISIFCIPLILMKSKYAFISYILIGAFTVLMVIAYLNNKRRYIKILNEVENYPEDTKLKLRRKSIIYVFISIAIFIWVWYKINIVTFWF